MSGQKGIQWRWLSDPRPAGCHCDHQLAEFVCGCHGKTVEGMSNDVRIRAIWEVKLDGHASWRSKWIGIGNGRKTSEVRKSNIDRDVWVLKMRRPTHTSR